MKMKSVIAGEYTAPPAHGPMIRLICGITPTGHHVALEHVGIAAERGDALLDARATRIVEPDHRRADLHRLVHHLADLLGVRFRERTAEDGEVLAEDEHQPAIDHAVAGDDAVAGHLVVLHAEVGAAMLDEHVPFLEGAFVEQQFEALARGQLALACAVRRCASGHRPGVRRRACSRACSMMSCMSVPARPSEGYWRPKGHEGALDGPGGPRTQ